jgi:putative acetyltransferase
MVEHAIRPLGIEDYHAVVALWRKTEGIELSDTDEKEPMRRFLSRNPGLSLVAYCRDELAGAVLCSHDGRRGYMHHLAVGEQFRRRGIGSALVQEALSLLCEEGIRKCNIFILPENQEGVAFWQRNGFRLLPDFDWMQAISEADD